MNNDLGQSIGGFFKKTAFEEEYRKFYNFGNLVITFPYLNREVDLQVKKDFVPLVKHVISIRDKIIAAKGSIPNAVGRYVLGILETHGTKEDLAENFQALDQMKETRSHLFFGCLFAKEVWRHIREWSGLRRSMSTIQMSLKWLLKESRDLHGRESGGSFILRPLCTIFGIEHQMEYIGGANCTKGSKIEPPAQPSARGRLLSRMEGNLSLKR
ncbi:hypothetical protein M9H77_23512 [Catharanthus roseus]|uniref:Uncharacterized protein n=1 Tax=Catharanthus roseus TaxID=4058 RepID=A0ACC0AUG7_CATRO|nr:hypothetical protein M9H77_23512 [Catharanthus roseus]